MIIGIMIIAFILASIFGILMDNGHDEKICTVLVCVSLVVVIGALIFGCFNGFIDYPATEGTHQGVITAVDLEGKYFRRYEVYLKSSGYTTQSDETVYQIYEYEKELAEELKEHIGKEVKLNYGHDGGYIGWKSFGTYHIKSVEFVGNTKDN